MDYDGVIIEYKGTNRMRIVGSAQKRTVLSAQYHEEQLQEAIDAIGSAHMSPTTGGPNPHWGGTTCLDFQCWKTSNKKAHRGWMRHPKRTTYKRRTKCGQQFYVTQYFPSIHNLADNLI